MKRLEIDNERTRGGEDRSEVDVYVCKFLVCFYEGFNTVQVQGATFV
jgi:hypothetical protein